MQCETSQHTDIKILAAFLLILWPVGSLVLFTLLAVACFKALQRKMPTALTRATAFLHTEYKTRWCWWEVLELLRKIVLVGMILVIPERRSFLRFVVATLICSVYVVVLAVVKPYKRIEDHVLAVVNPPPPPAAPPLPSPRSSSNTHRTPNCRVRTSCCCSLSSARAGRRSLNPSRRTLEQIRRRGFSAGPAPRPPLASRFFSSSARLSSSCTVLCLQPVA